VLFSIIEVLRGRPIALYRNAYLIYNPFAGKLNRSKSQLLQRTIEALRGRGHAVQHVPTTGPQTAAAIARESIASGADLILAAGGDGTINEVMNGMVGSEVPLGVLPAGTANVLACEMRMNYDAARIAGELHEFVPARIAVGKLHGERKGEDRHFLLMAGAGLDALIVYSVNPSVKAMLGKVAYWIGGFAHIGKPLTEFNVEAGGQVHRCSFALASRVKNYGGDLSIARDVSLFDDDFELVLFQGPSSLPYIKYFAGVMLNSLKGMKGVLVLRANSITFGSPANPDLHVQIDGEHTGLGPARLSIVPKALTLLFPPGFHRNHTG
jgi:diacylglycerol kinase (ATP)